jgi:hypothetical protein
MLNPGGNRLADYRRSWTCRQVKLWADPRHYDGAVYLNLFSYVDAASEDLWAVPAENLVAPGYDVVISDITSRWTGLILAGWGGCPARFPRRVYDDRIAKVMSLIGREVQCLGITQRGYPKHGLKWREEDEPVPFIP